MTWLLLGAGAFAVSALFAGLVVVLFRAGARLEEEREEARERRAWEEARREYVEDLRRNLRR